MRSLPDGNHKWRMWTAINVPRRFILYYQVGPLVALFPRKALTNNANRLVLKRGVVMGRLQPPLPFSSLSALHVHVPAGKCTACGCRLMGHNC